MKSPRLFIIGTDTEVGKTTVSVALIHAARRATTRILPFKPAVSGELGETSDHARLARAAQLDGLDANTISVHRFAPPLAPGLIEPRHHFFDPRRTHTADISAATRQARERLEELEAKYRPDLTLIEGAGGLHVPMPGGSWLEAWVPAFQASPVIVARAGLGTINHTILTVEALRRRALEPLAFILNEITPVDPQAVADNRAVLEARLELPCLGVMSHRPADCDADEPTGWLADDFLDTLMPR